MRSLPLLAAMVLLSGCNLFFDDGGSRPDTCDLPTAAGHDDRGEPEVASAPLRNPERLTCEGVGQGCDPECGPCPETTDQAFAPSQSWGICGSSCEALDETSCAANSECRVVRDARCAVAGICLTDFLGCFPLDNNRDASVDCFAARDGWTCSLSAACSALHDQGSCANGAEECARNFAVCVPEGKSPGKCHDPVTCDAAGPACPAGTTAGIENGCFTGACIPLTVCENSV